MVRVHRDVVVSVGSRATQVIALPAAPGWSGQRAVVRADVCLNERPPATWPAVWFERLIPTHREKPRLRGRFTTMVQVLSNGCCLPSNSPLIRAPIASGHPSPRGEGVLRRPLRCFDYSQYQAAEISSFRALFASSFGSLIVSTPSLKVDSALS